jgi:hypothetical protein
MSLLFGDQAVAIDWTVAESVVFMIFMQPCQKT